MLVRKASQSQVTKTESTYVSRYTDACVCPNVWNRCVIVIHFNQFLILTMCEISLVATHRVKDKRYLSVE